MQMYLFAAFSKISRVYDQTQGSGDVISLVYWWLVYYFIDQMEVVRELQKHFL